MSVPNQEYTAHLIEHENNFNENCEWCAESVDETEPNGQVFDAGNPQAEYINQEVQSLNAK